MQQLQQTPVKQQHSWLMPASSCARLQQQPVLKPRLSRQLQQHVQPTLLTLTLLAHLLLLLGGRGIQRWRQQGSCPAPAPLQGSPMGSVAHTGQAC
jgi:hypothetical protein